jgi:hypothetical protein
MPADLTTKLGQLVNVLTATPATPLLSVAAAETVTSTSAAALAVGRQGTTNPVLNVDASTASVVTGLNLKGAAAAGGMALSVTSSGTNENLTIDAKGSGTVRLNGTATGGVGIGMTPTNILDITQSTTGIARINLLNNNAGTGAGMSVRLENGTANAQLTLLGTGFTTLGINRQSGAVLQAGGAGGLTINTTAAQPIYFGINSSEAARFDTSGNLLVGTTSTSGSSTTGKIIVGGIVKTVSGTTSVPANTATTLFTVAAGSYLVTAYSEATGYAVTGIVTGYTGGPAVVNLAQYPGAGSLFSISGSNLQVTFTAGTYNCVWSAIRFS